MVILVIAGLVMAVVAVLFAFQNAAVVAINFGTWEFEQSLAIVLICTLGLGIIISLMLSLPTILKRNWQVAKYKRKLDELQTQLQSQNQTTQQLQQSDLVKQSASRELLQAFALADTVTSLLTKDAIVQLSEHLLGQMQNQPNNPRYSSLVVMLLEIKPANRRNFADVGSENAVYKAIANRFNNGILPDSFLGITDRKRFVCLTLGLRGTKVTEYAEYLQQQVTRTPLQKADGAALPLKMNIGGVIVDPTDEVDSRSILQQAEQNLAKSLATERSYLEITEVTHKTL